MRFHFRIIHRNQDAQQNFEQLEGILNGASELAATASAVATTPATNVGPYGYSQAQADAIPVAINDLIADVEALKAALG